MTSVIGLDEGRVIALKEKRRVAVGPYLSFVFENRRTLLFQIQEMCRVERLPGARTLSATLFIETADQDQIRPVLDRFMGLTGEIRGRSLRRGEGQARRRPLRTLRLLPGGGAGVRDLRRLPGGGPSRLAGAHPPVRRDPSRSVDRPRGLTGARGGARAYCMIQNQT
jgi:hypothetical protein